MRLLIGVLTILIFPTGLCGQQRDVYKLPIPKNIEQSFKTLLRTMSENEIELIKTWPEDSIYAHKEFKYKTDFFHAWKIYDGSRLTKYFNKMGLVGSFEIYETILISFHRHLNNTDIDLTGQIKKYQARQRADYELYQQRLKLDSINGVYIPKDIDECMTELDRLIDEKWKYDFAKEEEQIAVATAYRPGPGIWMRNNWGLWGGSRLQKYFSDKGVKDPEEISWIILTCYHRHVNGNPLDFEGLLKNK
jgi:hypothetical protein